MSEKPLFGCIEAGGTKFVLGVLASKDAILETTRMPTGSPEEAIRPADEFFSAAARRFGTLSAFGIARFSAVDLDHGSSTWGHITATPKPGWSGIDLPGPFASPFNCPVGFDTDANGAILARWGCSLSDLPADPVGDLIQPPARAQGAV